MRCKVDELHKILYNCCSDEVQTSVKRLFVHFATLLPKTMGHQVFWVMN